jgi:hypothetical protein
MISDFIFVTLATFALSTTIATTPLLDSLRRKAYERSQMWGKLASCPYCLSHWIAAVFVPLTGLRVLPSNGFVIQASWFTGLLNWLIGLFAVVGMSAIIDVLLELRSRLK